MALAGIGIAAFVIEQSLGLGAAYIYKVLGAALVGGALVVALAHRHLGSRGFGAANGVTLARGAATLLVAGLLGESPTEALGWLAAALTCVVLVLDGVDGRVARARGTASRFGARFDMETDAALGLVLALLVLAFDKAGAYVLVAGLARYVFVLALVLRPRLDRPLAPSRRRQAVCVAQIAGLAVCLVPVVVAPASDVVALVVVAAVCASFGADLRGLVASARTVNASGTTHA